MRMAATMGVERHWPRPTANSGQGTCGQSSDGGDATCPMTTTMHPHTGLQNSVQSPPQGQAQINPPPDDPSPAPPIVPQNTGTQRRLPPPNDANDIDPRAQEKRQKAELCTLASAYLLDLLSLATNALVSFPSKTFGHIPNVPIFASWDKR